MLKKVIYAFLSITSKNRNAVNERKPLPRAYIVKEERQLTRPFSLSNNELLFFLHCSSDEVRQKPPLLGSLRNGDGDGNENVISKYNFSFL